MTDQRYQDLLDKPFDGARRCRDVFAPFMKLSSVLVGRDDLPEWVGRAYLALLVDGASVPGATYTRDELVGLLDCFSALPQATDLRQEVQRRIVDGRLAPAARAVVYVWYTASLPAQSGYPLHMAPADTYATGLIWEAISAHPMGITGPYFGHWGYPPPRPIERP